MISTSRIPEVHHPHMCTTRIHQHRPHPRTVVNVLVYSDPVQYVGEIILAVTELYLKLFQLTSHFNNLPPLSHLYHRDQTVWCQLPTSLALWPMRAPLGGSGLSHLESPLPRCGSLMAQAQALCRYPRSLLPIQGHIPVKPATMRLKSTTLHLLKAPFSFNSIVSDIDFVY